MNMQIIFNDENGLVINMTDINPELPIYGIITYAAMDDDMLPNLEIEVDGYLYSETPVSLDNNQEKFYTYLMYQRFQEMLEKALNKILDGDLSAESINRFNSLTPEELAERKCQQ